MSLKMFSGASVENDVKSALRAWVQKHVRTRQMKREKIHRRTRENEKLPACASAFINHARSSEICADSAYCMSP
jgi:hypothetical protein